MTTRGLKPLIFIGGIVLSTTAFAGPSATMLAQACAACHGAGGNSAAITPNLAGTDKKYFVESMKAFKDGTRKATIMDRIAKGYSEEQIEAMAGYFAGQKHVAMSQPFDKAAAAQGKKLHKQYCEKCHEEGGRSGEEATPLAGQSLSYLNYSMEDFHAGHREIEKKMKRKVDELTEKHGDKGLAAVIQYYGSQQ